MIYKSFFRKYFLKYYNDKNQAQLQLAQPDRFKRVYCQLIQYTPVYLILNDKKPKENMIVLDVDKLSINTVQPKIQERKEPSDTFSKYLARNARRRKNGCCHFEDDSNFHFRLSQ